MALWTSNNLKKALNVKLEKSFKIVDIAINSKQCKKNYLFIAIKGEKFDGHKFINEAFKNGATAFLVETKKLGKLDKKIDKKKLILVKNSVKAIEKLAMFARLSLPQKKMICVTGSTGKTTIKEWLKEILSAEFKTFTSPGNFNNHIGMPLSLSRIKTNTEVCILELGMSNRNEIKKLSKLSKPNISIITNIGPAHISNFNNQKEIANEKSDIFLHAEDNISIIPRDSKYYKFILKKSKRHSIKTYSFGFNKQSDFYVKEVEKCKGNKIKIIYKLLNEEIEIISQNYGEHLIINRLIIFAVSKILGVNLQKIKNKISKLEPADGRGNIKKVNFKNKNLFIFDDSYNSNPLSLKASLNSFGCFSIKKNQRKICIIGDMLELGNDSEKYHKSIIKTIVSVNPNTIYTVGTHSRIINKNLPDNIKSFHYNDTTSLFDDLSQNIKENDVIMIKGSNSINLGEIIKKISKT